MKMFHVKQTKKGARIMIINDLIKNEIWRPEANLTADHLIVNDFANIWGVDFATFDEAGFRLAIENAIIERGYNRIVSSRFSDFEALQKFTMKWLGYKKDEFTRFLNIVLSEYNPMENYDKYSTITNAYGEAVNKMYYDDTESTFTQGATRGTNTNNRSAFNSSSPVYDNDNVMATDEATNKNEMKNHEDKQTSEAHTDTITDRTHGNIGTTTFGTMYSEFLAVMMKTPVISYIADAWLNDTTTGYYIAEYDE